MDFANGQVEIRASWSLPLTVAISRQDQAILWTMNALFSATQAFCFDDDMNKANKVLTSTSCGVLAYEKPGLAHSGMHRDAAYRRGTVPDPVQRSASSAEHSISWIKDPAVDLI